MLKITNYKDIVNIPFGEPFKYDHKILMRMHREGKPRDGINEVCARCVFKGHRRCGFFTEYYDNEGNDRRCITFDYDRYILLANTVEDISDTLGGD